MRREQCFEAGYDCVEVSAPSLGPGLLACLQAKLFNIRTQTCISHTDHSARRWLQSRGGCAMRITLARADGARLSWSNILALLLLPRLATCSKLAALAANS